MEVPTLKIQFYRLRNFEKKAVGFETNFTMTDFEEKKFQNEFLQSILSDRCNKSGA